MAELLDEKNLAHMFMDRFLNRHYPVLNAISDILSYLYKNKYRERNLLEVLYSKGDINQSLTVPSTETKNIRSLKNAWYHECSLNYPSSEDERMKFPAWKIIQCYYAVFSSISALVRSFDNKTMGHDKLINSYGTLFLRNHERKHFCIIPISIHLKQDGKFGDSYNELLHWEYGKEHHLPKIIKGLEKTKQEKKLKGIVTIPHYLKYLRDWATYEDSYLFSRMYGEQIRKSLDNYLRIICTAYISHTEFFMIKYYGFDLINSQKEIFSNNLEKSMDIKSSQLNERFEVHRKLILA